MKVIRTPRLSGLLAASFLLCAVPANAQRDNTDVITLKNGDRVTGEILQLEYGLLRLETDLVPAMMSAVRGGFEVRRLEFRPEAAACVVMAAEGYPGRPVKGARIEGLARAEQQPGARVFHSGTARTAGGFLVAGGRVLSVCATGGDLHQALQRAYAAVAEVSWPGCQMRPDIGRQVLSAAQLKHSGVFRLPSFPPQ